MKVRRRVWINVPPFPILGYVGEAYATKAAAATNNTAGRDTTVPAIVEYTVAPKKRRTSSADVQQMEDVA